MNETNQNEWKPSEDAFRRLYELPELHFRLNRYRSEDIIRLVGVFIPVPKPEGQNPPKHATHVWMIAIKRSNDLWLATATCDDRVVFNLSSTCRYNTEYGAVAALFSRLRHTCRRTRLNIAAGEEAAK